MPRPAALLILCLPAVCSAERICRYEDADGRVTYSTAAVKGAARTRCFESFTPPPPKPAPAARAPKPGAAAETGFPTVDSGTQKRRDADRRRILEQELADERDLLERARRALTEAERVPADPLAPDARNGAVRAARDALTTHERNAAAIERELARVR